MLQERKQLWGEILTYIRESAVPLVFLEKTILSRERHMRRDVLGGIYGEEL